MALDSSPMQLINEKGTFDAAGLRRFINSANLHHCGNSYAVVAIIGPQSSGKSTLLNHLFKTSFQEMDTYKARNWTTKGVWIAKAVGIKPSTIIMDVEGSDSSQRGEDGAAFENQSALFVLAIADIVLINIWCKDIGREHGGSRPLLKTVFEVMMRMFSPRKTTLLFVMRDKTKTPFESLETNLRVDIQKIWETLRKPQKYNDTPLSEVFNVEVTALASFEYQEEQFKEQVAQLRQRFVGSISPGGLAGDRRSVIPASAFSFSAEKIWKDIKANKDLNLPAHKVLVATVRCEEIAAEKYTAFAVNWKWLELKHTVKIRAVSGFGREISSILEKYLSEYDTETQHFEKEVRSVRRKELETRALELVHPSYISMLGYLCSNAFKSFKAGLEKLLAKGNGFAASVRSCHEFTLREFDKGCSDATILQSNWDDAPRVRAELRSDMDAHASSVREKKLTEVLAEYKKQLSEAVIEPLDSLFNETGGADSTWDSIRLLVKRESDKSASDFSSAIADFELDQAILDKNINSLKEHARWLVEQKSIENAESVLNRMMDSFSNAFRCAFDPKPSGKKAKDYITEIETKARGEALNLLATVAIIRLDGRKDNVERVLFAELMECTYSMCRGIEFPSTWKEVPGNMTLITPDKCKYLWYFFKTETNRLVTEAYAAQEAWKKVKRDKLVKGVVDVGLIGISLLTTTLFGVPIGN